MGGYAQDAGNHGLTERSFHERGDLPASIQRQRPASPQLDRVLGEMVFVESGEAVFRINSREYEAKSGCLVFLNSFEPHEVEIKKEPYRRYFAMVDPAEMERAHPLSRLLSVFKNRPDGFSHCVDLSREGGLSICAVSPAEGGIRTRTSGLRTDAAEHSGADPDSFHAELPANFIAAENGSGNRIGEVQRYIEAHFTEDLKISRLAEQFFLNHCYLTPPLQRTGRLQPETVHPVKPPVLCPGAAGNHLPAGIPDRLQCGFGDANNFIRAFRTQYGLSPNQYRTRNTR